MVDEQGNREKGGRGHRKRNMINITLIFNVHIKQTLRISAYQSSCGNWEWVVSGIFLRGTQVINIKNGSKCPKRRTQSRNRNKAQKKPWYFSE